MSIKRHFSEMILNGSKPLVFMNNIGKYFEIGSTVYIYESKSNKGQGKVIGEFKIKNIVKIPYCKVGTYPFLLYYAENILKDVEIIKAVKRIYDINLVNYDNSLKLSYIFNPEELEQIDKTDKVTDLLSLNSIEYKDYMKKQDKSKKLCYDCDKWLRKIGYYNWDEVSYYKYYIEVDKYLKYSIFLDISNFKNKEGKQILKAPKLWCYV